MGRATARPARRAAAARQRQLGWWLGGWLSGGWAAVVRWLGQGSKPVRFPTPLTVSVLRVVPTASGVPSFCGLARVSLASVSLFPFCVHTAAWRVCPVIVLLLARVGYGLWRCLLKTCACERGLCLRSSCSLMIIHAASCELTKHGHQPLDTLAPNFDTKPKVF